LREINDKKVKNISIALNLVLIVAVAILYYFQFSEKQGVDPAQPVEQTQVDEKVKLPDPVLVQNDTVRSTPNIVYVDLDILLAEYKRIPALQKQLEREIKKMGTKHQLEVQKRMEDLQKSSMTAQELAANRTPERNRQEFERLENEKMSIMKFDQQGKQAIVQKQVSFDKSIQDDLINFLKEYNTVKQYDYILSYQELGGILHASQALSITREVVDGLNAKYAARKSKPKKSTK